MTARIASSAARLPAAERRAASFFVLAFLVIGLPRLYTNTIAFTGTIQEVRIELK